ncbi:MAG: hypothetical protein SFY92_00475 [Verrucomicrobiae bacterium]|nr:hypothetical protein [Verrucomicrobiae bacterium]
MNRLMLTVLLCLLPLMLRGEVDFYDPKIQEGVKLHDRGVQGDKESVGLAFAIFEGILREQPDNMIALAYHGSTLTLKSRDAFPGPSKLEFLKKGIQELNQAAEKAPDNLYVRLIRGINFWNLGELPFLGDRRKDAKKDFYKLVELIEAEPKKYDKALRQGVYYYAGLALREDDDDPTAVRLFVKGMELNPASETALKIRREMMNISQGLSATPVRTKQ